MIHLDDTKHDLFPTIDIISQTTHWGLYAVKIRVRPIMNITEQKLFYTSSSTIFVVFLFIYPCLVIRDTMKNQLSN